MPIDFLSPRARVGLRGHNVFAIYNASRARPADPPGTQVRTTAGTLTLAKARKLVSGYAARLPPGRELQISFLLPEVGWRTPAAGFVSAGDAEGVVDKFDAIQEITYEGDPTIEDDDQIVAVAIVSRAQRAGAQPRTGGAGETNDCLSRALAKAFAGECPQIYKCTPAQKAAWGGSLVTCNKVLKAALGLPENAPVGLDHIKKVESFFPPSVAFVVHADKASDPPLYISPRLSAEAAAQCARCLRVVHLRLARVAGSQIGHWELRSDPARPRSVVYSRTPAEAAKRRVAVLYAERAPGDTTSVPVIDSSGAPVVLSPEDLEKLKTKPSECSVLRTRDPRIRGTSTPAEAAAVLREMEEASPGLAKFVQGVPPLSCFASYSDYILESFRLLSRTVPASPKLCPAEMRALSANLFGTGHGPNRGGVIFYGDYSEGPAEEYDVCSHYPAVMLSSCRLPNSVPEPFVFTQEVADAGLKEGFFRMGIYFCTVRVTGPGERLARSWTRKTAGWYTSVDLGNAIALGGLPGGSVVVVADGSELSLRYRGDYIECRQAFAPWVHAHFAAKAEGDAATKAAAKKVLTRLWTLLGQYKRTPHIGADEIDLAPDQELLAYSRSASGADVFVLGSESDPFVGPYPRWPCWISAFGRKRLIERVLERTGNDPTLALRCHTDGFLIRTPDASTPQRVAGVCATRADAGCGDLALERAGIARSSKLLPTRSARPEFKQQVV
eukprot:m.316729 g.316729  ORF g.316729 m.316729 type:complete len:726 (-) comp23077_c1_seq2:70-2247(-)